MGEKTRDFFSDIGWLFYRHFWKSRQRWQRTGKLNWSNFLFVCSLLWNFWSFFWFNGFFTSHGWSILLYSISSRNLTITKIYLLQWFTTSLCQQKCIIQYTEFDDLKNPAAVFNYSYKKWNQANNGYVDSKLFEVVSGLIAVEHWSDTREFITGLLNFEIGGLDCRGITTEYRTCVIWINM